MDTIETSEVRKTTINGFIDTVLKECDAEDNTENRLAAAEGLMEAWNEDEEVSIEKTFWKLSLSTIIMGLKIRLMYPRIAE